MATVTGLTAERMLEIEAASVIAGAIVGNNLILTTHGGASIDAGHAKGTRWGTTTTWIYGSMINVSVEFADNQLPHVGDYVVSTNGLGPGGVGKVIGVLDGTHATLQDTGLSIRGAPGTPADETAIRAYADTQDVAYYNTTKNYIDGRYTSFTYTGTTDASGFLTVTHALGYTPSSVIAQSVNPSANYAAVWGTDSITATTFRVRYFNTGTGNYISTSIGTSRAWCFR